MGGGVCVQPSIDPFATRLTRSPHAYARTASAHSAASLVRNMANRRCTAPAFDVRLPKGTNRTRVGDLAANDDGEVGGAAGWSWESERVRRHSCGPTRYASAEQYDRLAASHGTSSGGSATLSRVEPPAPPLCGLIWQRAPIRAATPWGRGPVASARALASSSSAARSTVR